ncbi:hypothetical protein CAPTEDRAFT_200747 [Capitella teleta]|uniref:Uncharacterized protein n=1 Tax=Capitella teleta TaxID=283909 RepID=R7TC82_CAPTE|nr:hypothetical protein CAPTEDRAFT_200747 [Capitella teleta]|eukprot:ELT91313.1 hypothetical protein CAPTEDRAFT_200747 [Capitella teleta]
MLHLPSFSGIRLSGPDSEKNPSKGLHFQMHIGAKSILDLNLLLHSLPGLSWWRIRKRHEQAYQGLVPEEIFALLDELEGKVLSSVDEDIDCPTIEESSEKVLKEAAAAVEAEDDDHEYDCGDRNDPDYVPNTDAASELQLDESIQEVPSSQESLVDGSGSIEERLQEEEEEEEEQEFQEVNIIVDQPLDTGAGIVIALHGNRDDYMKRKPNDISSFWNCYNYAEDKKCSFSPKNLLGSKSEKKLDERKLN